MENVCFWWIFPLSNFQNFPANLFWIYQNMYYYDNSIVRFHVCTNACSRHSAQLHVRFRFNELGSGFHYFPGKTCKTNAWYDTVVYVSVEAHTVICKDKLEHEVGIWWERRLVVKLPSLWERIAGAHSQLNSSQITLIMSWRRTHELSWFPTRIWEILKTLQVFNNHYHASIEIKPTVYFSKISMKQ